MRRALGVLIALIPFAIVGFCLLTPHRFGGQVATVVGYALLAFGALLCLSNAYLSWIRPRLHLMRGGSRKDYQFVSGFPLFGTLFLTVGLVCAPPSPFLALLALPLIIVDTGGLHWFVIYTWADRGFWEDETEGPTDAG